MADSNVKPAIVYDITGFDRSQVVEQLEGIVNHVGYRNINFSYYFGITKVDETDQFCKFFRLKPNPTPDQPGNGSISVFQGRPFDKERSYGQFLVNKLRETYGHNTRLLAKGLKNLFKNNTKIASYPFLTSEVYILWLFEIARRRVKDSKNSTNKKKAFDELEINEAITNLIELMNARACIFEDVFLKKGIFHCFSGLPFKRRAAIKEIKDKLQKQENEEEELLRAVQKLFVNDA